MNHPRLDRFDADDVRQIRLISCQAPDDGASCGRRNYACRA